MKGNINRRILAMVLLSLLLLMFVVAFSFLVLIPKGKEYRSLRLENKKEERELALAREEHDRLEAQLKKKKETHKKTIDGFKANFDPEKFARIHAHEFQDLFLTEKVLADNNGSFKVYEVNATTKISSPQSFYHFLEKVNESNWVIGVDFPIHFEREGDLIKSSFTMKVHHLDEAKGELKQNDEHEQKHPSPLKQEHH